jgi:hypothetical protein
MRLGRSTPGRGFPSQPLVLLAGQFRVAKNLDNGTMGHIVSQLSAPSFAYPPTCRLYQSGVDVQRPSRTDVHDYVAAHRLPAESVGR